jgi:hypothetical protein
MHPTYFLTTTLVTLLSIALCTAQITQPDRVELASLSEAVNFQVVPVGTAGAMTFYMDKETKGEKIRTWVFKKLNTDLQEEWTKNIDVERSKDYVNTAFNEGKLYVLFQDYRNGEYQMLMADAAADHVELTSYDALKKFRILEFVISGDMLFASGFHKMKPALVSFHLRTKESTLYDLEAYGKRVSIEDLQVDEASKEVTVCLENYNKKTKTRNFIVKNLTRGADSGSEFTFSSLTEEKWLLNATIKQLKDNAKLIIGTYSNKKRGGSQGVYIAKYVDGAQQFMKYYSFTEFSNFFAYLNEKQQLRVDKAIEKKKEEGKELNLNYRLLVHNIIEQDDRYLFIGEAFYPQYHTETHTEYRTESYNTYSNGKTQTQTRTVPVTVTKQVFDGFRFTHAVVAGFTAQGDKLWDNCFEIWDVLTRSLKEQVKVDVSGDKVGMVYVLGNQLVSKYVEGDTVVEGKKKTLYETGQDGDKLRYTIGNIEPWYDNYFLAWGFQNIKNESGEKDTKRKVYFANKIAY